MAQAAALVFCLDIRPLSFCDGHLGMHNFAQTIFEMGQSVPANEKMDLKSYFPGRTATTNAVKDISTKYRLRFINEMKKGSLKYGGEITIDNVHLKVQGKLFYDFTLHYMEINNKGPFDSSLFNMKNVTLLLIEGLETPSAQNIKNCLNAALLDKYELSMDHFFRGFTIVTDGAAVMAKVANASVSRGIHTSDETWMRCMDIL